MGRKRPDVNLTLRMDPDLVMWSRLRAFRHGTSLNAVIRRFLETYAAVPEAWWEGKPPPWTPGNRSNAGWEVGDPVPAGIEGEDVFAREADGAPRRNPRHPV
jgi:hypothetical protein